MNSGMTVCQPDEPRGLRTAMGRFASGVTIITTVIDGEIHGMTANGFMSVSLEPPLVLVSVGCRSRMHELVGRSGRYAVSVLADDQLNVSAHFARMALGKVEPEFELHGENAFVADALAHVGCAVSAGHPAGDHTLFVGAVEYLAHRPGNPLLFHSGAYREVDGGTMDDGLFVEIPVATAGHPSRP